MSAPDDTPTNQPVVRTDLVDVYVFRRGSSNPDDFELLQLRRCDEPGHDLHGTWQPVMGHLEGDETAPQAAARELEEETGLTRGSMGGLGLFALEQVHPYYLASRNAIMFSPRFGCEVPPGWEPTLNHEHDAARWVPVGRSEECFMWPGQRASIRELHERLIRARG